MDRITFQNFADQYGIGHKAQKIYDLCHTSIRLTKNQLTDPDLSIGISKIGGDPDVPIDFEWPYWQSSFLSFLMQINLSDLQKVHKFTDLPASGVLTFFFEHNSKSKLFDPADQGSYQVYFFDNTELLVRRKPPAQHESTHTYMSAGLEFEDRLCFPHPFSNSLESIGVTDAEIEHSYWTLFEEHLRYSDPKHQLFGHPFLYQSDFMDVTCQLVSNGIDAGDYFSYHDPKLAELRAGAKDWVFLLQIDSDEGADMFWGISEGSLYFWIKKEHLKGNNFQETYLAMQFI